MTNNEEKDVRKLAGCGVSLILTIIVAILGLAAGVIYTLFMVGSWIGQQ